MEIVSQDPKRTGVTVLTDGKRKLWVWQNRKAWSTLTGTTFTIEKLPGETKQVKIYGWDGLRKTVPATGGAALELKDLPTEETLLFLAIP